MNVLLIPAHQIVPDKRGEVDARGFIAEVKALGTETMKVKCEAQDGQSMTMDMTYIAAGVYRWGQADFAVFKPFNPARGDAAE